MTIPTLYVFAISHYCEKARWALVEHPSTVRPIFTQYLPLSTKLTVLLGWGKIRSIMKKRMDLGREQGAESQTITDAELTWIDGLLADGRSYLVGDRFSRADIAVASLLSPLVLPDQHPTYAGLTHPPRLAATVSAWADRPSLRWVREIYAKHR